MQTQIPFFNDYIFFCFSVHVPHLLFVVVCRCVCVLMLLYCACVFSSFFLYNCTFFLFKYQLSSSYIWSAAVAAAATIVSFWLGFFAALQEKLNPKRIYKKTTKSQLIRTEHKMAFPFLFPCIDCTIVCLLIQFAFSISKVSLSHTRCIYLYLWPHH